MIPIILTGGDLDTRAQKVDSLYDFQQYALTKVEAEERSILIDQIHELVQSLGVTSRLPRLVWIVEADRLTLAAQNALLKVLEEPPGNTQIILSCANYRSLLPTILSRCTLVNVKVAERVDTDGSCLGLIKRGMAMSEGDRVVLADSLGRKREVLMSWTNQCLLEIEEKMQVERSPQRQKLLANIAKLVHEAAVGLNENTSTGLTMQHIFLHLPRSK